MKKLLAALFILCFLPLEGWGQQLDMPDVEQAYAKREVMIPMRDGAKLYTAVYEPRSTAGKHPVLLYRTPYGCKPYGPHFAPSLTDALQHYVGKKYIIVFQDVRGRYLSEGHYENVRPVALGKGERANDVTDAYDTAEWLVKNTRTNGSIGVSGNSYLGYYALTSALCRHPAIKAVCPQAPIADWFMGDDIHHNGALMLTDAFRFLWGFGRHRPSPQPAMPALTPYYTTDEYSFFLRQGSISELNKLKRDSLPFWDAVCTHPDYDEWWLRRSPLRAYAGVDIPVLLVGGLFDAEDAYGTWSSYKALARRPHGAPLYLLVGPWKHGGWLRGKGNELGAMTFGTADLNATYRGYEQRFFDYYLQGEGTMALPPATVFFTGANSWHTFSEWPPQPTSPVPLYLHAGGKLSFDAPADSSAATRYVSDPAHPVPYTAAVNRERDAGYMTEDQRFAERRADVATFVTPPLERSLWLCGEVVAELQVALSTTDADFVVKLIDVFPDSAAPNRAGYEMLVRGDVMRGRYRRSFSKPVPFVVGQADSVRFSLPDVAHTFLKGHRIMVQIQSSWFPLVDRNPQQFVDIYRAGKHDFVPSAVTIFHNKIRASRLLLPVWKR
ncbi:MAG TPA: CocE/NonD family hydrolase [Prevotella sp.]